MIEISGVKFSYGKKEPIFENLDLSFLPGRVYGLLGKNGAGKTTLLKIISGLLFPQNGKCTLDGYNVALRDPKILQEFYFLPEMCFLPPLKIIDYVEIYSPFYPKFAYKDFIEYAEAFELNIRSRISDLSYGQKKKLSIAFALAIKAKVLLLDEPTNGLDIPAKSIFRKIISSAIDDERMFIISTHQVRDMRNIIDQIMIVDEGKVIFNQNIADIESRLSLSLCHDEPLNMDVLYYEKTLGGYATLTKTIEEEGSDIDTEFLFNAVIAKRNEFAQIFMEGGEK